MNKENPIIAGFDLPFAEQADFFRGKLKLPTERWDDIKKSAHDRAFIVAGAQKADLLNDLQQAVQKAIDRGTSFKIFYKDFRAIVKKHGWTGWTGEGSEAGERWRARVIYRQNLLVSQAAGRYRQFTTPEMLARCPYWRYIHHDGRHNRPHHKAWGDIRLTLRYDHPFWKSHYPPNGWLCRCEVLPVSAPKEGDSTTPPEGWDKIDEKTGAPIGIDKGWDYAPGASVAATFREIIDQKLINLEAPIGAAMWERLKPVLAKERSTAFAQWIDEVLAQGKSRNDYRIAGVMTQREIDHYAKATGAAPRTSEIAIEDRLIVGRKAERHEAQGNALTPEEWKSLPDALENERRCYFDREKQNLLYVLPSAGERQVKLAVEVDFMVKNQKRVINLARAGFKIDANTLDNEARYEEIK